MRSTRRMSEETLKVAIERVFSQWTALKFVMEHGTAGNFQVCKQLHDELVLETMEYLIKGADESFISDLLFGRVEEDFMVSIEDESDRVVARLVCEIHHRIYRLGDLNVLASIPVITPKAGASVIQGEGLSDTDGSSDGEDVAMDSEDPPTLVPKAQQRPQADEDGWFTVPKRN